MAAQLPVLHARDTAFSYTCGACSRCCYGKRIVVNPYELARLARHRDLSTTELIARFTVDGGTALAVRPDGGCVFLGGDGCTVHADRPLVCRLYPLGRIVQPDGGEIFVEVEPHPETAGVYGRDGTVGAYVESQGVAPYIAAGDRYYAVLVKLMSLSASADGTPAPAPSAEPAGDAELDAESARFVDADLAVRAECQRTGEPFPADVESLVDKHIAVLERWVERTFETSIRPAAS